MREREFCQENRGINPVLRLVLCRESLLTKFHGLRYAAELPSHDGGSCLLLGERRRVKRRCACRVQRRLRWSLAAASEIPFSELQNKGHTGGTTTPPCVFLVPRKLFQENTPKKPLRHNGFSFSVSWNRVFKILTLFQENEGVCSKKKRHEKATQSEWMEWLFHPSLTERIVLAIMVTGKRCYQHRLQHMRGNSHTTAIIVPLGTNAVKMGLCQNVHTMSCDRRIVPSE